MNGSEVLHTAKYNAKLDIYGFIHDLTGVILHYYSLFIPNFLNIEAYIEEYLVGFGFERSK